MADYSGDSRSEDQHPGDVRPGDEHPENELSDEESSEKEHSEEEDPEEDQSDEDQSDEDQSDSHVDSDVPAEDSDEDSDKDSDDYDGNWYDYLGIDSERNDGSKESDPDFRWGWADIEDERTFPRFMQLPAELRLMIWRMALPKPRCLHIAPQIDDWQQWRLPREMFAPDVLNPGRFETMPLAEVCRESRAFIKHFGYERLWENLMTVRGDAFGGLWFCWGRDYFEAFDDETIIMRSKFGRGDWIFE
ncbi:hypothetical protein F5Y10DRAFT_117234 [Nemania abortiva]|nr:hypothetical protein F5Y10DRAFT_117234 [Nemania abortiva]